MSEYQLLPRAIRVQDKFWSPAYRCFVTRRELVLEDAERVLGSRSDAERWFTHSVRGLGYQQPCSLVSTSSGYREVQDFLGRVEYGVYT
ncbi:antitoxin Xre/MbcA/ParS toxin-binding domain-containing protein [Pseudomonas sp. NPDC090202]|uniref:antitoxin Xre/MbcA/ParS toxin-binding domain-containing protein n=1 Tax=Pseudomonas sp. NPDC090202 TaxID=3364476 RepID=UPI00383047BB